MGYYTAFKQFVTGAGLTSEKGSTPSLCVKCGKCETHCPQHIPIIKELVRVKKKLEPWLLRFAASRARAYLGKKRKKANAKD
jgi:predicted aldo/keto reductase-like oxidoreductase